MVSSKSVFAQALERGGFFSFLFFLFFMMCVLPIFLLFVVALIRWHLWALLISLLLIGILVYDFRRRDLFVMSRDMVILNMTLWFLLGFFAFIRQLFVGAPVFLTYALLVPYALVSGGFVFYLLSKAQPFDHVRILRGGVAISVIIALISAVNGAIIDALVTFSEQVKQMPLVDQASAALPTISLEMFNPHVAFLLVLVIFNIPFLFFYWKGDRRKDLWLYAVPVAVYVMLSLTWRFVAGILLAMQ